jgi:hypothetical protein
MSPTSNNQGYRTSFATHNMQERPQSYTRHYPILFFLATLDADNILILHLNLLGSMVIADLLASVSF